MYMDREIYVNFSFIFLLTLLYTSHHHPNTAAAATTTERRHASTRHERARYHGRRRQSPLPSSSFRIAALTPHDPHNVPRHVHTPRPTPTPRRSMAKNIFPALFSLGCVCRRGVPETAAATPSTGETVDVVGTYTREKLCVPVLRGGCAGGTGWTKKIFAAASLSRCWQQRKGGSADTHAHAYPPPSMGRGCGEIGRSGTGLTRGRKSESYPRSTETGRRLFATRRGNFGFFFSLGGFFWCFFPVFSLFLSGRNACERVLERMGGGGFEGNVTRETDTRKSGRSS